MGDTILERSGDREYLSARGRKVMAMKGSELLIKALQAEGVDTVFAYPGVPVISIFDELYKQQGIRLILPRHEQALVHAADGYARATGKPGVCLVTSGPGATNTVTAIAAANYDSVPIVCFTGQVRRDLIGNDAFQEVDIIGITRNITKYNMMVMEREDLGRAIKEAFYIATTGKPGPVIVDLPADVINAMGSSEYPSDVQIRSYRPYESVHIGQIKRASALLRKAQKPLFLAGGGIHISRSEGAFTLLAERAGIPVISTIMGRGAIPTDHPLFIGNVGMHGCYAANQAVMECDVLCSIGSRFNDRVTGKVDEFAPHAKIIHIDIDTASISRNVQVDIPIVAEAGKAIESLLHYTRPCDTDGWLAQIDEWKKGYPLPRQEKPGLTPRKIIESLNSVFPECIVVTDVGQHQMWTTQYLALDRRKQLLTSGGLGAMGYGLPAAIGAQLGDRSKKVICVTGDGGFQMNLQEMATAVLEGLPVIVVIFNNGYLGMVRQWQQLLCDRRYSGTDLAAGSGENNPVRYVPDFVKLAESYGAQGVRVFDESSLHSALEAAGKQTRIPTIIECMIEREEMVYPMVKAGAALNDMVLEG